jgi:hypothetical protein
MSQEDHSLFEAPTRSFFPNSHALPLNGQVRLVELLAHVIKYSRYYIPVIRKGTLYNIDPDNTVLLKQSASTLANIIKNNQRWMLFVLISVLHSLPSEQDRRSREGDRQTIETALDSSGWLACFTAPASYLQC